MAACPPSERNFLRSLLDAARTEKTTRPFDNRHWRNWAQFAVGIGQHPLLPNCQGPANHLERTMLFVAFAVALRQGRYHAGVQVKGAEIERALRECAQLMVSQGLDDPRKATTGDHKLDPSLTNYYKTCKTVDPPPQPQQALPSSTIRWIMANMGHSPNKRLQVAANLVVLAFFFLLRVGEYTKSRDKRQTVPLRKQDIKLWVSGMIIPNDAPLDILKMADAVTICLENQKNGHKNATLHHTCSGDATLNPVQAAAYLLNELRGLPPSTPIGSFMDLNNNLQQVTSAEIRSAVQLGAHYDNLVAQGYTLSRIGTHSIRSGGAMHLKLAGYDNDIIQKLGRWSSNTYLTYIQSQIGQLTAGVARRMASIALRFHIVA
jgi:hypothetical protein